MHNFNGSDGSQPDSNITLGSDASIYGVATGLPNPVKLTSANINPASVQGNRQNATFQIIPIKPAPSSGATLTLASSNSSAATVPAQVTVPAGSSSGLVTITTKPVTSSASVTIQAAYNSLTASAKLTVIPIPQSAGVQSIGTDGNPVIGGSTNKSNFVYLTGKADPDLSVTITSSNPSVAKITTTQVAIETGSISHVFTIQTSSVSSDQTVTITATANRVSQSSTWTVTP